MLKAEAPLQIGQVPVWWQVAVKSVKGEGEEAVSLFAFFSLFGLTGPQLVLVSFIGQGDEFDTYLETSRLRVLSKQ